MADTKYEDFIWKNTEYFKKIYESNEEFFIPKGQEKSDAHYIQSTAFFKWVGIISKKFNPYKGDLDQLKKDLKERRGRQYSNGTLYSSSRFVAELFKTKENRNKLLKILGIKEDVDDFKWILEYRLPIPNLPRPAQMDLVIENNRYFIGIESKMKEIYSNHQNDFNLAYENSENHYLAEFNGFLNIDFHNHKVIKTINRETNKITIEEVHHASIEGFENCNFYYKQQICHLLGMRQKQIDDKSPQKNFMFLNLAFDPTDIDENENEMIERYKKNEEGIMKLLKPHFAKTKIQYMGLITQKDILY